MKMARSGVCADHCLECAQVGVQRVKALTEENERLYRSDLEDKWTDLPPRKEIVTYTVYKLSSIKEPYHHSLLFVCELPKYETKSGFTIGLIINEQNGEYEVIPKTKVIKEHFKDNLQKLGEVSRSAQELIETGLKCMREFGNYGEYSNNCQDFCKKLAGKISLEYPRTDVENVKTGLTWGVIAAGVIGAIGLGAYLLRPSKKDEDEDED